MTFLLNSEIQLWIDQLVTNFQIADGMSVQINTVNLLLETRGGSREKGGAAWLVIFFFCQLIDTSSWASALLFDKILKGLIEFSMPLFENSLVFINSFIMVTDYIDVICCLIFLYSSPRASPMASITIRNLMLYTTNENWEVLNQRTWISLLCINVPC